MAQADGGGQAQAGGGIGTWLNRGFLALCVYVLLFGNPFKTTPPPNPDAPAAPPTTHSPTNVPTPIGGAHRPLLGPGVRVDLYMALADTDDPTDIELTHQKANNEFQWFIDDITYDNWDDSSYRQKTITFPTPPALQNNGSFYAHVWLVKHGANPSVVRKSAHSKQNFYVHSVYRITKFLTVTTGSLKKNLLSVYSGKIQGNNSTENVVKKEIVSHWRGNVTLALITDYNTFPAGGIPPQVTSYFDFDEDGNYWPIVWSNDFWILKEDYKPLNETVTELTLDMHFEPLSLLKFSVYAQMGQSFSMQRDMFGAEEGESEDFKRMLIDNPPWLLGLTMVISLVHSVLDMLAFKNEIQFWKERKSMKGLSLKTIYINIVSNVIILLYLWDNDTNWLILISALVSTLIEAWKITKAATVRFVWKRVGSVHLPWFSITELASYSSTKSYDEEAMKYLIWAIYPLVIAYAAYSLYYEDHKSWYSFVVGTLAGCVYTFGFIMMTPQLFINYRLKSVAHLPWRTFVYKGINTFIDDLFAFIIRMPTMHRLRCFRDDLIFIIYLYQRWIYPIDPSRLEVLDGELGESADSSQIEQERLAQLDKKDKKDGDEQETINEPKETITPAQVEGTEVEGKKNKVKQD